MGSTPGRTEARCWVEYRQIVLDRARQGLAGAPAERSADDWAQSGADAGPLASMPGSEVWALAFWMTCSTYASKRS